VISPGSRHASTVDFLVRCVTLAQSGSASASVGLHGECNGRREIHGSLLMSVEAEAPVAVPKSRGKAWVWLLILAFCGVFYAKCGFYSLQPIGAAPEGGTALVWRDADEPFFNSADALCIARTGGVSLLCRGLAMSQAPIDRIIVRLPYMEWAYLQSSNGSRFDR
jgi:hypothetical protein